MSCHFIVFAVFWKKIDCHFNRQIIFELQYLFGFPKHFMLDNLQRINCFISKSDVSKIRVSFFATRCK